MFAVAGSGKTTYIVDSLSNQKRSLIVTYTIANYENLRKKIIKKFNGEWPESITLMTFFSFLYRFCYKPFMADAIRAKGIIFEKNPNKYVKKTDMKYYLSAGGFFYSNRLSMFIVERADVLNEVKKRITKYFDEFVIDEVQDIAGRDFSLLESFMQINIKQLYVGDFYQHTYDTSRDGVINKNLFDDKSAYEKRFIDKGFTCDVTTLVNSWRCSQAVCRYITEHLGIEIHSNRPNSEDTSIMFIKDLNIINRILEDKDIVKLHYKNGTKFGIHHRNWGETKGEDHYQDVCVLLNETTAGKYKTEKLSELAPGTRNKLYVAITRAHRNVYLMKE